MDGKPRLLNQFRHQTMRRQSFAIILSTVRSWPEAALWSGSSRPKAGACLGLRLAKG